MVENRYKAFKYRLYPNKATAEKLQWTLDRCRELYNAALDERKSSTRRMISLKFCNGVAVLGETKTIVEREITKYGQSRDLTEIKRDIRPEYQQIGDHILRNVLDRVDLAFKAFFARCKAGKTPGFPRFQGRDRYDSFSADTGYRLLTDEKRPTKARLRLGNIGEIKLEYHRPVEGAIKRYTVKRDGDQWYVTLMCEVEMESSPVSSQEVGIDLGVTHFAALSDGSMIDNPRHYRRTEKRLQKLQQVLSRKKRGSNRRKKAVKLVAKAHRKIRNQRRDFHHKASRHLVNQHQLIVFEDLQTANLTKRPKPKQDKETGQYLPNGASAKSGLNKSINDASWYSFTEMTKYKAAWAGRVVVFVNPRYTSQICSGCGAVVKKDLSERWHSCSCGCELDRDTNAAINILRLGQKQLAQSS